MQLVFIYGSPAVGKLTVAEELTRKTDFKLFHNHRSVDLVKSVFDWGTEEFSHLNRKIRLDVFEMAAKKGISGIVFTYCFRPGRNEDFIRDVIKVVEKYQGEIHFIYLHCDENEMYKRAEHKSRKKSKIRSAEEIKKYVHLWGKISKDITESFEINNTDLSPKKAAQMIIEECGLNIKE
ncbi:MAG TPA: hypothetical protein DIT25_04405 [Candidatus Moranbacteria bacterium]|nr:hypothetical protein [Candidatus Moranbacteria bacterium]